MKQLFLLFVLLYSINTTAQDHKELEILEADSTWLKELIKFPLGFAPDIDYEGYEDIRFAQHWSKPESSEFFTYAFVWNINLEEAPTVEMLNDYMAMYYDGLMTAVNKNKDITVPDSEINFEKDKSSSQLAAFKGNMKVYDAFFTKKVINLYAKVETFYCKDQNKYILLFRISTFDFENAIWDKLNSVKLIPDFCDIN